MNETTITMAGNLVAEPELRFTPSGQPVTNLRIASTARYRDGDGWKDGDTLFIDVVTWRGLAENTAESCRKGGRVIVTGRLKQRAYVTRDGEKRTAYEIEATDVGLSLQRAAARPAEAVPAGRSGAGSPDFPADEPPF